jgi:hypothetical protein
MLLEKSIFVDGKKFFTIEIKVENPKNACFGALHQPQLSNSVPIK